MKNKKIIFLLTREQWLALTILLLCVGGTMFLLHQWQPPINPSSLLLTDSTAPLAAHQAQHDSIQKAQWKKQYPQKKTTSIHLQPFDPNTADSATLIQLGLQPWQVSNLLKYRAKNGRYRQPQDFRRLYGMTDSAYHVLLPYIAIDTTAIRLSTDSLKAKRRDSILATQTDTTPPIRTHKKDTLLNIRTTDTTGLKAIPGIGSYRAKQIIRYRQQLGGFVSTNQLREIKALHPLFTDSLAAQTFLSYFFIDSMQVEPLRINFLRPEQLQRHPYISLEQAKAIYELRRKNIRLNHIQQLQQLPCFTNEQLHQLEPYLSFEKETP